MFEGFAVALAALGAALPSAQAGGGLHKDEGLGFQIQVPKDWKAVPLAAGEKWMVAKYLSNREYLTKKEWRVHTPEMRVVHFPAEVAKDRGPKVKPTGDGKDPSDRVDTAYVDYKSYLEENSGGGGLFEKEEQTTVNGIPTTCLEIKLENLMPPRRAMAWIFKGEDAEWAVHFEALGDWWEKLAPEFTRCLRTFKFIPRKGSVTARAEGEDLDFDAAYDSGTASAAERAMKRATLFERALQSAGERLPEGWTRKKTPHFHAFSHADERYTSRVLDQAEAMISWLGQNFAWVGEGLPGPAILRICRDNDEWAAFVNRSKDAGVVNSFEVSAYKDRDGWGNGTWGLYSGIAKLWFADKNPLFRWGMPPWLESGVSQVFGGADVKGGKVEFKVDQWQQEWLRETRRKGKISTARALLLADSGELPKVENSWLQCGTLLRFLWTGPKASQTKETFKKVLQAHLAVVEEEEAAWEAAQKAKGNDRKKMTAEERAQEEEERSKERKQGEKKRLEKAFQRAFGDWTEADWASFERAYAAFGE